MILVPRNVIRISPYYRDLGLTFQHHSSLNVLEQVGSHYEDREGRAGTRGLLLRYMVCFPNFRVVFVSST